MNTRDLMINVVVACSDNFAIGRHNKIPWDCRGDLRLFSIITKTGPKPTVIMGRKTMESIGKTLPGRRNIVVTSRDTPLYPDTEIAKSLDEAIQMASDGTIYVCGGASLYKEVLSYPNLRLHLSRIHITVENADTFIPEEWRYYTHRWREIDHSRHHTLDGDPDWSYSLYQTID